MYNEDALFRVFKAQCTCDKEFMDEFISNHRSGILLCAKHLLKHEVHWPYLKVFSSEDAEFLEFIDGNGFKVVPSQSTSGLYHIYPIQHSEVIDNEGICNRYI